MGLDPLRLWATIEQSSSTATEGQHLALVRENSADNIFAMLEGKTFEQRVTLMGLL